MAIQMEVLFKAGNLAHLAWKPYSGAFSYRLYVGLSSGSLTLLYDNISALPSQMPADRGKIGVRAPIEDIQNLLGLTTESFLNTTFFFTVRYLDSAAVESPLVTADIIEVQPVGVAARTMRDDPSLFVQNYVFCPDLYRWVKMAGSSSGALATVTSGFYSANTVTEYTYDGTNLSTEKVYPSDATVAGSPAKLTTYEYSGSQVTKITITDSTV